MYLTCLEAFITNLIVCKHLVRCTYFVLKFSHMLRPTPRNHLLQYHLYFQCQLFLLVQSDNNNTDTKQRLTFSTLQKADDESKISFAE